MAEYTSIDVRRTSGGLRLTMHASAARCWTTYLSYGEAEQLIGTIRAEHGCALPTRSRDLAVPRGSRPLCVDGEAADAIASALRAHMPDRMRPFGSTSPSTGENVLSAG
ncbi:MAG TPA: hypothetical protein VJX66_01405 [Amycolatopsis sp.]|nr:hypothetical protein [Amycolatopsis sp.]